MPQVWQPSHLTRQQLEERRLAIQPFLLDKSRTPASLAEEFGVKPGTIRTWRRRLQARGSLEATLTTGRPTRLTDAQVAELLETLQRGPDLERFPDGRWTTHRVREVIGLQSVRRVVRPRLGRQTAAPLGLFLAEARTTRTGTESGANRGVAGSGASGLGKKKWTLGKRSSGQMRSGSA